MKTMTVQEARQIIAASHRCRDPRVVRAIEIVNRIVDEGEIDMLCHFGDLVLFGQTVKGWNPAGIVAIAQTVFENAPDADLDDMLADLEGSAGTLDYWRMVDSRTGELVGMGVPRDLAGGRAEAEITAWCS